MNSPSGNAKLMTRGSSRLSAAVLLLMLGLGMVISDPYFTFIDDEVQIISAAANPFPETVDLFIHGTGQFEHPPLYDLLLHCWLRVTGGQMRLLRLPSIGFYLLGIWILVETARGLCGDHVARAVLWVCILWPFGFHFGRLAAWYSLSFLLVAILTYTYLAFLRARTLRHWLLVMIPAILLLYTSYFGWAILACVLLDYLLKTQDKLRQQWSQVMLTFLVLVIAFLPLARAFSSLMEIAAGPRDSVLGMALFEAFNTYSLFASESVAPWHWAFGVPVCLAVTVCVAAVLLYGPPVARRLFVYFMLLITGMSLLGIVGTKRSLLISAWVVLPVGLCLGTIHPCRWRACLFSSLLVIMGIGWFGTVSRRFYAAPRFIEPWNDVAKQMAGAVRDGGVVIANHPSFFFYLYYELRRQEKGRRLDLARIYPYRGLWPRVYDGVSDSQKGSLAGASVFLVKDVSSGEGAEDAELFLEDRCALKNVNQLLPDTGFSLKERFLPRFPRARYRIEVRHYNCEKAVTH
jgi:hypothetical protein